MGRELLAISCCLVWSPCKSQVQPLHPNLHFGPNEPYTQDSQQSQQTIEVKSPLIRTLVSRLAQAEEKPKDLETHPLKEQTTDFLSTFLQHLQTRRMQNQTFDPQSNRLELTIRGASQTELNLEFSNNMFETENFNRIIELLADSLALVVQEAEKLGFHPSYNYVVVSSNEKQQFSAGGFGGGIDHSLNPKTLMSAVG